MTNKRALVITYHVKNCKRVGGFHKFISYLVDDNFDIDWYTSSVSLSWIWHKKDNTNIKNFFELVRGFVFKEKDSRIRQFSVPVLLPAFIARYINKELYNHYWPKWKKVRKKLAPNYDIILVEGTGAQYALDLKRSYPNSKIIYRPSDILCVITNISDANDIEKQMIDISNITYCVDEIQLDYYLSLGADINKLQILRNPMLSESELGEFKNYKINEPENPSAIYLGVSGVDLKCIEYAAKKNPDIPFVVIGPFNRTSHDNITYTGSLLASEYNNYLKNSVVGLDPVNDVFRNNKLGYTRKIIRYMLYLMPVVVTYHNNYKDIDGFIIANGYDDFAEKVRKAFFMNIDERQKLYDDYVTLFECFTNESVKKQFDDFILN